MPSIVNFSVTLILMGVSLLVSPSTVQGQNAPPVNPEEEAAPISLEFSIYTWNQQRFVDTMDGFVEQHPELFYYSGGEWDSITVRLGGRTDYYNYKGTSPLVLFTQEIAAETEQPAYRPYAMINLNPSMNRVVVLLFPHLTQSHPGVRDPLVQSVAIEPITANFKADVPVFHNLSNLEVALRYNQKTQIIPPYGSVAMSADQAGKRLQLELATPKDGAWDVVLRTSVTTAAGSKMMILLDTDAQGERWSLRRIVLD